MATAPSSELLTHILLPPGTGMARLRLRLIVDTGQELPVVNAGYSYYRDDELDMFRRAGSDEASRVAASRILYHLSHVRCLAEMRARFDRLVGYLASVVAELDESRWAGSAAVCYWERVAPEEWDPRIPEGAVDDDDDDDDDLMVVEEMDVDLEDYDIYEYYDDYLDEGNDDEYDVVRPASVAAAEKLIKTGRYNSSAIREADCVICMNAFDESAVVAALPCSHVFHSQCLKTWIARSHVCPLCRYELPRGGDVE